MRNLEKIIKDKLEGYEVNPPEGSLADFRQKLVASRSFARKPSRSSLPYIVTAGVAAACLAFVWIMMQPEEIAPSRVNSSLAKVSDKNLVSSSLVLVNDSSTNAKTHPNIAGVKNVTINTTSSLTVIDAHVSKNEIEYVEGMPQEEQHSLIADLPNTTKDTQTQVQENESSVTDLEHGEEHAIPRFTLNQKIWMASGGILAATLGGAVLASLGSSDLDNALPPFSDPNYEVGNQEESKDVPWDEAEHFMPLKLGLSARWKFTSRWALTSGLEYSRYKSNIKYSLSGTKSQYVHYIGLPIRLDYTIVETRWMEVYLGAGSAVDYCVKATVGGESTHKDGFSFSLQGAGGVQLNITRQIGVFMEPQISWFKPASENRQETYRTDHPVSFNISGGVRYTISR